MVIWWYDGDMIRNDRDMIMIWLDNGMIRWSGTMMWYMIMTMIMILIWCDMEWYDAMLMTWYDDMIYGMICYGMTWSYLKWWYDNAVITMWSGKEMVVVW